MSWNFQESELSRTISEKLEKIIQEAQNEWLNKESYQRFYNLLVTGAQRYKEGAAVKVIGISEDAMGKLGESVDIDALFTNRQFVDNTFILVDEGLNIINASTNKLPSNNEEARALLVQLSADGYLYFEIFPSSIINRFIQGEVFDESPFFSAEEYTRYVEKKPINQIAEVLEDYRKILIDPNHYSNFFLSKASLKSLFYAMQSEGDVDTFVQSNTQLLRNRPENLFREDLREYLRLNIDAMLINKELTLDDGRRIDISAIDKIDRGIYLIEVKWLGQSIHHEGKHLSAAFDQSHIVPSAFNQTADYIRLLSEKGEDVKRGFLVVFDARKGENAETGYAMTMEAYTNENRPYVRKFEKIKDYKVINIHPA